MTDYLFPKPIQRDAVLSPCGMYRYQLGRSWNPGKPTLNWVMLNPSVADWDIDDPTIRKCVGFAQRFGFGSICVTNLFAYRATDPAELKKFGFLVGPENDQYIRRSVAKQPVIVAWGAQARGIYRAIEVLDLLKSIGSRTYALATTSDNIPRHPLMLPYSCKPTLYEWRGS